MPVRGYEQTVIPDPIYKEIGSRIRTRRKALRMTQEHLAKALGVSRGSLANVETGRQNMLVHQLYSYAAELQLIPEDLLPPRHSAAADLSKLPMPNDLKPEQRNQLARLIDGLPGANTNQREVTNDKSRKA
jgi:transcriptional regulator with XRE-family HTH domain